MKSCDQASTAEDQDQDCKEYESGNLRVKNEKGGHQGMLGADRNNRGWK